MTGQRRARHLQLVPSMLPLDGVLDTATSATPPPRGPAARTSPAAASPTTPPTAQREHRRREDDDVAPERRVPRVETCDPCGGEIRWFITAANRKRIPVDATPDPAGKLRRLSDGTMAVIPKATQRAAMHEAGVQFWMPHVATCPKKHLWASKGAPSTNRRERRRGALLPADRSVSRPPAATHQCPCGCGRAVLNRYYACGDGWARLPRALRRRITETNGPHANHSDRAEALRAAARFYATGSATEGR